jgi:hypothetical protein
MPPQPTPAHAEPSNTDLERYIREDQPSLAGLLPLQPRERLIAVRLYLLHAPEISRMSQMMERVTALRARIRREMH